MGAMEIVQNPPRLGARKYDWDAWAADDQVKRFRKGEDFDCQAESFAKAAASVAKRRGWRMQSAIESPESVLLAWQHE